MRKRVRERKWGVRKKERRMRRERLTERKIFWGGGRGRVSKKD